MILLIDKSAGMTSFDVIRQLRRKLNIRKMGHAGTLDPAATGLLIVATEHDTKKLSEFLKFDKEYEGEIEFGKVSDTYDGAGKIAEVSFQGTIDRQTVEAALKDFEGKIWQMPPRFSAKKIKGVPAYKLARQGKLVELKARQVTISKIEILAYRWPILKIRVTCSSGTYLRSLAHDLGQKLGCGGYLKSLRRTRVGHFRVEEAESVPLARAQPVKSR